MLKLITLLFCVCTIHVQAQTYFSKVFDFDSAHDFNYNAIQLKNGAYTLVGYTFNTSQGTINTKVLFLDQSGDTSFTREFNFSTTGGEIFRDVVELDDGSFVSGGLVNDSTSLKSDMCAFRFDTVGNLIWQHQYGIPFNDYCESMKYNGDGTLILAGSSYDSLNTVLTANLIKIDTAGNLLWNKHYSGGTSYCEFYDAKQTIDGGFIAAGRIDFNSGDRSTYVVKTNSDGDTLWTKIFNPNNNTRDVAFGIVTMLNGNIVLAGGIIINNGAGRGYVMLLDSLGNIIWDRNYPVGTYNSEFQGVHVDSTSIYCVGMCYDLTLTNPRPSGLLTKLNLINGDTIWNRLYRYYPFCDHYLYSINPTSDNGFVLGGWTLTNCNVTQNDIWIIKVDSNGCDTAGCLVTGIKENQLSQTWNIYPNPSSDLISIKTDTYSISDQLIISNCLGEIILKIFPYSSETIIDIHTWPTGLYQCNWLKQGNILSKKIVILR